MNPSPDVAPNSVRVLIVDDERHNRQLLEVMLGPEGFILQTAASGEEALAMVAQQAPDLILLDLMMPGMDGHQVATRIKTSPDTNHIPIIVITALDHRYDRVLALSAGAEEFLTKPVDRVELVIRIRNLLRLKAYGDHYEQCNQQLEGEAVSRTADLADRTKALALADSELRMLIEMERSRRDEIRFKDEFLSHVSHELRSPLTAIKQFTSILQGGLAGELNEEQREYQQIVMKNIEQLQAMIDDLLAVTRLETGKLPVTLDRVSVSEAVTDIFNTLQVTARTKGVTLSRFLPADLPDAHADRTRLRQILIILLDNAIKFTAAGGAVTIRVRRLQQDPRLLLFEVSDTGCGISPEAAERVFERLYQVTDTSVSRTGLGLGLYICRELLTRQGGQIWVASELQKGSTFSFTLPVSSPGTLIDPVRRGDQIPHHAEQCVSHE